MSCSARLSTRATSVLIAPPGIEIFQAMMKGSRAVAVLIAPPGIEMADAGLRIVEQARRFNRTSGY